MNNILRIVTAVTVAIRAAASASGSDATYSYTPVLLIRSSDSSISYYRMANMKTLLAENEHAQFMRAEMECDKEKLDLLLQEEQEILAIIWSKTEGEGMPGDMYFNSEPLDGSKANAITRISPRTWSSSVQVPMGYVLRLDGIMDDLGKLKHVKVLGLDRATLELKSFEKIAQLKDLELLYAPVNTTDEVLLMLLKRLPSLKYVCLWGCSNITGSFVMDKEATKNLVEVKIVATSFDPKYLSELITLPRLKFIALDGMDLYINDKGRRDPFGLQPAE